MMPTLFDPVNVGPSPAGSAAAGEALKCAALALHDARRPALLRAARRFVLLKLLADPGTPVTADDVRAAVELPPGVNPKAFGATFSPLALAGIVRAAGHAKSARKSAHARLVTIWRLNDAAKALAWLRDNPAPAAEGTVPA